MLFLFSYRNAVYRLSISNQVINSSIAADDSIKSCASRPFSVFPTCVTVFLSFILDFQLVSDNQFTNTCSYFFINNVFPFV
jgi:hypothetical protein